MKEEREIEIIIIINRVIMKFEEYEDEVEVPLFMNIMKIIQNIIVIKNVVIS